MLVLITRACVRCQNPVGDAREVPTRHLWSEYDHDHHDYDHEHDNVMLTMLLMIAVILQLSDWKLASMNKGGVGGLLSSLSPIITSAIKSSPIIISPIISSIAMMILPPLLFLPWVGVTIVFQCRVRYFHQHQGDSLCTRCQLKLLPRDKNDTQMQWNTNAVTHKSLQVKTAPWFLFAGVSWFR